ncbi:Excinuclease ABC, A subunit [Moritella viscosa]|nr:Excinuclease ABC, A subunit [Moritella viscosa]
MLMSLNPCWSLYKEMHINGTLENYKKNVQEWAISANAKRQSEFTFEINEEDKASAEFNAMMLSIPIKQDYRSTTEILIEEEYFHSTAHSEKLQNAIDCILNIINKK